MRPSARLGFRTLAILTAAGLLATQAQPAAAIEVCRANALGQTVCFGNPPTGLRTPEPFPRSKTGLSRVQQDADVGEDAPTLIPPRRTNIFGDTVLGPGETRRPKPRYCQADTLGGLRC